MIAIDKPLLAGIMKKNRASLAKVKTWIADCDYENSLFYYGVPRYAKPLLDDFIGEETTYSDIIAYFAAGLSSPVRYLEIGVSVGKNFFQMLNVLEGALLVGLEIEDINPVLERFLIKRGAGEWPTMPGSLRKSPSRLIEYEFAPNNNRVHYLAGDEYDENTWRRLKGSKFNLIFSDGVHSGGTLMTEWERIRELELLDADEFVMVWDDLNAPDMQAAFDRVSAEMRNAFSIPAEGVGVGLCRGWIGAHEHPHAIGFVRKARA